MGNNLSEQQQENNNQNKDELGSSSTIISIEELANLNISNSNNDQHFLYWNNVNYTVNDPLQGNLPIIKEVSGYAKGGRLLAIMGSSGSGKTTLLDILCNRILANKRTGTILFNGKETKGLNSFAYVPQQDLLLNTATVRETLETAAKLRISNIKTKDLNERIEIVLNDLGLKV